MKTATITEAKKQIDVLIDHAQHGETVLKPPRASIRKPLPKMPRPSGVLRALLAERRGGS